MVYENIDNVQSMEDEIQELRELEKSKSQSVLLKKIIEYTILGKIHWDNCSSPFSTNYFRALYGRLTLETEWLRDDRPTLRIFF